jgi:predicted HTH domain antitoxin
MTMFTVELKVPEAVRELGFSDEEICREVPVLLVLKRFRQGAISSSKAAGILGLSRRDFLDLLSREGIPVYDPSDDELAGELKTLQKLGSASS